MIMGNANLIVFDASVRMKGDLNLKKEAKLGRSVVKKLTRLGEGIFVKRNMFELIITVTIFPLNLKQFNFIIMRKFLFASMTFLAGILFFNSGYCEAVKTNGDTTYIYVYRVGQLTGAAVNWAVFLDDQRKCKLSNNKYIRLVVAPGKHKINAKIGGVGFLKKETEVEIEAESGGSYYIACNIKQSITRTRLELMEVTKGTANKQMAKISLDKCQESQD